jgi:hypothetical protein
MNVMRLQTEYEGPDYILCDSIEECMRFESHCSNIEQRVLEEDLAVENHCNGKVLLLNRMSVTVTVTVMVTENLLNHKRAMFSSPAPGVSLLDCILS